MVKLVKNYQVIVIDPRGIGLSDKPSTGYDMTTVAEEIHQLMNHLKIKNIA